MIGRLRRRFVIIAAVSLLVVEMMIIGLINAVNYIQTNEREEQLISVISENGGEIPEFMRKDKQHPPHEDGEMPPMHNEKEGEGLLGFSMNEETRFQTRYFVIKLDDEMHVTYADVMHIAAVSYDEAVQYTADVCTSGKTDGFIGNYRYHMTQTDDGKMYVFLDCRDDLRTRQRFLLVSAGISLGGWLLVCVIMIVVSGVAVKPFVENYEKQRRFITDAGHELKTPLAIISANTEVIEMVSEPSEWTLSIKNQVQRLNGLVADLLKLARMDEGVVQQNFAVFDLSDAFIDIAKPFTTLAENKGLTLEVAGEDGIKMNGDEGSVRQLVSILVENAVKYCDEGGHIRAELSLSGNGRHAVMTVSNDCKEPPEVPERLFDRFYRADSSRSREDGEKRNGYGIGLSVAKATVEAHKGKITCKAENGRIYFITKLRVHT
ncbi:MAG: HAMP domain-containing histidine kinase [Ruminococcus sp.]|nr:HAMP domain-containing histidine kinase [Ruminococcus sp.]